MKGASVVLSQRRVSFRPFTDQARVVKPLEWILSTVPRAHGVLRVVVDLHPWFPPWLPVQVPFRGRDHEDQRHRLRERASGVGTAATHFDSPYRRSVTSASACEMVSVRHVPTSGAVASDAAPAEAPAEGSAAMTPAVTASRKPSTGQLLERA